MEFDVASALIGILVGVVIGFLLKLRSLQELSLKVQNIGLSLGVKGFEEANDDGGTTIEVTGNQNKVAGRDWNEILNEIQESVDNSSRQIGEFIDQSTYIGASDTDYEFDIDMMFGRGNKMRDELLQRINARRAEGWGFVSLSADYQGTDGCILLFRRPMRR